MGAVRTIQVGEVLDLVLAALPDPPELDDPGELPYADAGTVAAHAVDLVAAGRAAELAPLLAVVERLHVEGDEDMRTLATVGYLEGLQNVAGHRGVDRTLLEPLLGPESRRWWRGLDEFWHGERRPGGVRPVD